ncbi:hypothetical protein AAHN93_09485 [Vandammella animalimorsus]|uniref:hypothetical protein n=1 Tax=Vandammella animalimorsus TaxID=2029117 RepID=UPI0031BBA55A
MKKTSLALLLLLTCSAAQPQTGAPNHTRFLTLEEAMAEVPYHPMDDEENIRLSDEIYKDYDAIRADLGDDFAGMWLEFNPYGKVYPVIAVANGKSIDRKWLKHGAVVVQVARSVKQLTAMQDVIMDAMGSSDPHDELAIYSSYVDERSNRVAIRAPLRHREKIMAKIQSLGVDASVILFEEQARPITLYGIGQVD